MTLRVLHPPEFNLVASLFAREFASPPPESGVVILAEEGGEVIGFLTLQQLWHAEPMWIKKSFRGTEVFNRLVAESVKVLPKDAGAVFVMVKDSRLGRLLEYLGFSSFQDFKLFRWMRS